MAISRYFLLGIENEIPFDLKSAHFALQGDLVISIDF